METRPEDLAWEKGRWYVKGDPEKGAMIEQIAHRAYSGEAMPAVEAGLDAEAVYDPPNLTFPFGAYVCVVDLDPGTAAVTVRRFIAVDDCGTRINPMIIEGQVHGGLTDGVGMALMEMIAFDDLGNCLGGSLMDYLIPTALEVPDWETDFTVTPSPHHPIGAKGVGESRDRRVAAGDRQRRLRRAGALRCPARRHAVHAKPCLGSDARKRRAAAMIKGDLVQRMEQLLASRTPFVTATVVRAAKPTSVRPGDSALVLRMGRSTASWAECAPKRPCGCMPLGHSRPARRYCSA